MLSVLPRSAIYEAMKSDKTRSVRLNAGGKPLEGRLCVPERPVGMVLFATGTAGARHASLERSLAARMHDVRLATYVMDLVSPDESTDRSVRSDIEHLCQRIGIQMEWLREQSVVTDLPTVFCGSDTGAAATAEHVLTTQCDIEGLCFFNGRLDLVESDLSGLTLPLLFFVDTAHEYLLGTNRTACEQAGVGSQHKDFVHSVESDAAPLVAHWVNAQVTETRSSALETEQTDGRHGAL